MMQWIIKVLICLIALEHVFILYFEMFAWETMGRKIFRGAMPSEMFSKTKTMAQNQGAYNGFLAAGLIWSLLVNNQVWSDKIALFFLTCVFLAGVVGAVTAARKIFFFQALPAALAILLICFS